VRAAVVLVAIAACGGEDEAVVTDAADVPPDACVVLDPVVELTIHVGTLDGADPRLTATIDGEAPPVVRRFDSLEEASDARIDLAVQFDGAEIGRYPDQRAYSYCLLPGCRTTQITSTVAWCLAPGGDLRYGNQADESEDGFCAADGFCTTGCRFEDGSCGDGERCGTTYLHPELTIAAVQCVPTGPRALGETCSHGPPGVGTGHDDCGDGLLCLDGTCVEGCTQPFGSSCDEGYCQERDDLPPGVGWCFVP
jgi:hypothetical protein